MLAIDGVGEHVVLEVIILVIVNSLPYNLPMSTGMCLIIVVCLSNMICQSHVSPAAEEHRSRNPIKLEDNHNLQRAKCTK